MNYKEMKAEIETLGGTLGIKESGKFQYTATLRLNGDVKTTVIFAKSMFIALQMAPTQIAPLLLDANKQVAEEYVKKTKENTPAEPKPETESKPKKAGRKPKKSE